MNGSFFPLKHHISEYFFNYEGLINNISIRAIDRNTKKIIALNLLK